MIEAPNCANCAERISRPAVQAAGAVYCCDGCVMGGPCICTYDGPAPKIDARSILLAAGYVPGDSLPAVPECANCLERFDREPVYHLGKTYCCYGCRRGGPCVCTYNGSPEPPPTKRADDGAGEPGFASLPLEHARLVEEPPALAEADPVLSDSQEAGHVLKANSLWGEPAPQRSAPVDTSENADAEAEPAIGDGETSNAEFDLAEPSTGPEPDDVPTDSRRPAGCGPVDETDEVEGPDWEALRVSVSPLADVRQVLAVSSALAELPSVTDVTLVRFGGNGATFEVEAEAARHVVGDVMESDRISLETLRMTSEGLELALRPDTEVSA